MAGKHYIIATQSGYIVNKITGHPEEFATRPAAVKALTELVRDAAESCRRSHKTCFVVGTSRGGDVQIRFGGRQGYHLWDRYTISERPGSRKPSKESPLLRELRASSKPVHATTRKTTMRAKQLDAEIAEALAGNSRGDIVVHATIATRNYEYVVYPEAMHRHAERSVKVPTRRGKGPYDLTDAKRVAKEMGSPAAIYSVSKGRFVGYVHPSGRYVTFR